MSEMMKRLIGLLLCLLLIPFAARAAKGDRVALSGEAVYGVVSLEDRAYALTRDTMYSWRAGETPAPLPLTKPVGGDDRWDWEGFFASGDELYALREVDGEGGFTVMQLCSLTPVDGVCEVRVLRPLDWEDLTEEESGWATARYLYQAVAQDGILYMVIAETEERCGLWRLDLMDEQAGPVRLDTDCANPLALCPAGDGALWITSTGEAGAGLWRYDAGRNLASQVATLAEGPLRYAGSLAVDPTGESLYYLLGGEVRALSLTGGGDRAVGRVPSGGLLDGSACLLADKYYVCLAGLDSVLERNVRPGPGEESEGKLTLMNPQYSYVLEETAARFDAEHPEVELIVDSDTEFSEEEIVTLLLTRSDSWDLMLLNTEGESFTRPRDRGYFCELDTPVLREKAGRMVPGVRAGLTAPNGALCAFPVSLGAGSDFAVNQLALTRLGMTEEDLPDSLEGMIRFLSEELPSHLPEDMSAFPTGSGWEITRFSLALKAIRAAVSGDMDEARLLLLLERVDGIDPSALHMDGEADTALFERFGALSLDSRWGESRPLFVGLYEGEEPAIDLSGTVLVVNPFSGNLDMAFEFVEYAAGRLDGQTECLLYTDIQEPPEDSEASSRLAEAQAEVTAAQQAGDREAEEAAKARLARAEHSTEYAEEALAWYRAHQDLARLGPPDGFMQMMGSEEMQALYFEYREGRTGPEALCHALMQKLRMARMEDE